MYALARDSVTDNTYSPEHEAAAEFLQVHNCFPNDLKDGVNRRTTPVWAVFLKKQILALGSGANWMAAMAGHSFVKKIPKSREEVELAKMSQWTNH